MDSEAFAFFKQRINTLKRRYLPRRNASGIYTAAQQDQMRAFRMLAHAEIEAYLERTAQQLRDSIAAELAHPRAGVAYLRCLSTRALHACAQCISANNGVKEADIRKMYEPLGFTDEDFDAIHPTFLDRMSQYGKQRGDVAHRSVASATYSLNVQREEAFIDELLDYLQSFDRFVQSRRLLGVLAG